MLCVLCWTGVAFPQRIVFVDEKAQGVRNGTTWEHAHVRVQDALAEIAGTQGEVEIRVAGGVYGTTTLWVTRDIVLKGGYAGGTMPDPDVRDVNDYPTALRFEYVEWGNCYVIRVKNADIVIDGFIITGGLYNFPTGRGYPETWGGAGLCLSGGNAKIANCTFADNRATTGYGGAVFVGSQCNVEIVNCTFRDNYSFGEGGALYNYGGNVDLYHCVFTQNLARSYGGAIMTVGGRITSEACEFKENTSAYPGDAYYGHGGAAASKNQATLEFRNSRLIGNTANSSGGAVAGDSQDTLRFDNSLLIRNTAGRYGGAVSGGNEGTMEFKNSLLVANAAQYGGAVSAGYYGTTEFKNSLLAANVAEYGGAIRGRNIKLMSCTVVGNRAATSPEISSYTGPSELFNCIVWGNEKSPRQDRTSLDRLGTCFYCCMEPGTYAARIIGNIEEDPAFALPGYWDPNDTPDDLSDDFWVDGDYHLKSQAGRWDPNSLTWVIDDVTSPCIDAGDPNRPVGDEPEPNGGRINMGAYGGTPEASKTHYPGPVWGITSSGDINGDHRVDFKDLALLTRHWLTDASKSPVPTNTSGQ